MRNRAGGFTLIELVIAMVVVAILAAIAVPSYRQYILRSHRVEAITALNNLAAAQEKFYLQNNTYTAEAGPPPDGLGFAENDGDTFTTENGWYDIEITAADTDTWSATATATAKDGQDGDTDCAAFTLDAAGAKSGPLKCWD